MVGTESPVNDIISSPVKYNYRSKITPHFNKPKNGELGPIGFQQSVSYTHLTLPTKA